VSLPMPSDALNVFPTTGEAQLACIAEERRLGLPAGTVMKSAADGYATSLEQVVFGQPAPPLREPGRPVASTEVRVGPPSSPHPDAIMGDVDRLELGDDTGDRTEKPGDKRPKAAAHEPVRPGEGGAAAAGTRRQTPPA
jgi:hypothetical protein